MSSRAGTGCLTELELEGVVARGEGGEELRQHIEKCGVCRERERELRENLGFMQQFVATIGSFEEAAPEAPPALAGYRLGRVIARGGQGVVYEATQVETRRRVAVKMIEAGAANTRGRQRIEREAEIAAGLRHPNIVTVYDGAALADGRYAMAMEFVDGVALDEWWRGVDTAGKATRETRKAAVGLKLRVFSAICDGVQYAHHHGVIHRDLKPANVLVTTDNVPRVVDFGVARRTLTHTDITRSGGFAGTLAYAAPEQVSGAEDVVDARSDVYALGLILYEMLSGQRPYDTTGPLTQAIEQITKVTARPLAGIEPGPQAVDLELEAIVQRALEKDRGLRYQTVDALRSDIENHVAGRPIDARPHSAMYVLRKAAGRHRAAFSVAAAVLVILIGFSIAMTWFARTLNTRRLELADALFASTIERARLVGLGGSNARAEEMLWPEVIRGKINVTDDGSGFTSSPQTTQATWALFETYSRNPGLLRVKSIPGISSVDFLEDGSRVRIINSQGASETRAVPSGELLESRPPMFPRGGRYTHFDGSRRHAIVSGGFPTEVRDFETGEAVRVPLRSNAAIIHCAITPDGTRAACVDTQGSITLWDVGSMRLVADYGPDPTVSARPVFTGDSKSMFAARNKLIHRWDARTGEVTGTWRIGDEIWNQIGLPSFNHVAVSPDGHMLVTAFHTLLIAYSCERSGSPALWKATSRTFTGSLRFSDNSSVILSAGQDRTIRAWDADSGTLLGSFESRFERIGLLSMSHDSSMAAFCHFDGDLRVWQLRARGWFEPLRGPKNTVYAVRFSPDGTLVAGAAADGSVYVWRVAKKELIATSRRVPGRISALTFLSDGGTIAFVSSEGGLYEWTVGSTDPPREILRTMTLATTLVPTADGHSFVLSGEDEKVHILSRATRGEERTLSAHTGRIVEVCLSPDGARVASVGLDNTAILWDFKSGTVEHKLLGHSGPVRAVKFSPDGRTLVTGSDDWTIRVWDVATGACIRTLRGLRHHVFALAFHPAGNVLFSSCRGTEIQVWDVRTGRELAVLEGHSEMVLSLAMSPDGSTLASGSADCSLGLWDLGYYRTHLRGNAPGWLDRADDKAPELQDRERVTLP